MRYSVVTERCQAQCNTVHWITTLQTSQRRKHVATQGLQAWSCTRTQHFGVPVTRSIAPRIRHMSSVRRSHRTVSTLAARTRDAAWPASAAAGPGPGPNPWSVFPHKAPGLWVFAHGTGFKVIERAWWPGFWEAFLSWSQTRYRSVRALTATIAATRMFISAVDLAINIAASTPRLAARCCQRSWRESIEGNSAPPAP